MGVRDRFLLLLHPRSGRRRRPPARGTKILLSLKEGAEEFAEDARLTNLVKTYSEFISFPIEVFATKSVPKQVEDVDATAKRRRSTTRRRSKPRAKGEEFTDAAPEPVMKTEYEDVQEFVVTNNDKPIWVRSPRDVEADAYNEFFKSTFKEFLDPLATTTCGWRATSSSGPSSTSPAWRRSSSRT